MNSTIKRTCELPGFYIKEELEARGWSQADLAFVLKMKTQELNKILSGKVRITPDTAVSLAGAFEMPAEFFTNLQSQYDLSKASPTDPAISKRALWQSNFPLREMIDRGWIEEVDVSLLDAQMMRFFEVSQVQDVPYVGENYSTIAHAAKKTSYASCTPEQIVWLHRVRHIAKNINAPIYDEALLKDVIEELAGLRSDPEDAPEAINLLLKAGVRMLIVEAFPKSKIDGVCTWIDDQPVIAITNRYDRLDNFWFVLRHELEHVMQGHGKESGVVIIDDETTLNLDNIDKEEKIANKAAANFCVEQKKLKSLIARKGNYVSEKDILAFSMRLGIHPSIVIGQYQHTTKKWNFLRKYLSNSACGVRKWLMSEFKSTNIIDGWGTTANTTL